MIYRIIHRPRRQGSPYQQVEQMELKMFHRNVKKGKKNFFNIAAQYNHSPNRGSVYPTPILPSLTSSTFLTPW
jgi:hypothetical protein